MMGFWKKSPTLIHNLSREILLSNLLVKNKFQITLNDLINAHFQINGSYLINAPLYAVKIV